MADDESDKAQPCFILKLPDEVLNDIVKRAASEVNWNPAIHWDPFGPFEDPAGDCPWTERYTNAAALCLVNRRFYQLAMPVLYSRFIFDKTMPRNGTMPAINELHRTLRKKPHLRDFCKSWHLMSSLQRNKSAYAVVNAMLTWFAHAEAFTSTSGTVKSPYPVDGGYLTIRNSSNLA
jgi:hypothetical protein